MKVALASEPWNIDPSIVQKEWVPYKFARPPKIAIMWWDGVVQPHPPMTRALQEVAEACRAAGMEVVDWDCEKLDHQKGWDILSALYWPDGGKELKELLESAGEPMLPLTKFILHEQPMAKELTQHELWKVSSLCQTMLHHHLINEDLSSAPSAMPIRQDTPRHGETPPKRPAGKST